MQLEVEQKYPVTSPAQLQARLTALGCVFSAPIKQTDLYFAHPARDFKQTDEALRLRRCVTGIIKGHGVIEGSGEQACITYKGPKLDATTKTRREIELPIAGSYEQYRQLLEVLGFRPVREVHKTRTPGDLRWEGSDLEVALDDVQGLGTFIELESLCNSEEMEGAKQHLASLAAHLGLVHSERRGYLDLLLLKEGPGP